MLVFFKKIVYVLNWRSQKFTKQQYPCRFENVCKNLFALTFVVKKRIVLANELPLKNTIEKLNMNCIVDLWFSFNLSWSMLHKRFKVIINGVTKKQNNTIILVLNFTILLWKFDSPTVDSAVDLRIVRSWSKITNHDNVKGYNGYCFLKC